MLHHQLRWAVSHGWEGSLVRELFLRREPFGRENVRIGSICTYSSNVDGQPQPLLLFITVFPCMLYKSVDLRSRLATLDKTSTRSKNQ